MKYKKQITSLVLALAVIFHSSVIANADNTTVTGDGERTCTVTAHVSSSYYVTLPASITLAYNMSNNRYEATYTVGAKGSIGNNQYISIIPDSSFSLKQNGNSTNYLASISQSITKWKNSKSNTDEMVISADSFAETTGKISVELPRNPGDYQGNFVFRYKVNTL